MYQYVEVRTSLDMKEKVINDMPAFGYRLVSSDTVPHVFGQVGRVNNALPLKGNLIEKMVFESDTDQPFYWDKKQLSNQYLNILYESYSLDLISVKGLVFLLVLSILMLFGALSLGATYIILREGLGDTSKLFGIIALALAGLGTLTFVLSLIGIIRRTKKNKKEEEKVKNQIATRLNRLNEIVSKALAIR